MRFSPEENLPTEKQLQERLIKQQWQKWRSFFPTAKEIAAIPDDNLEDYEFSFAIDRREQNESLFTSEAIIVNCRKPKRVHSKKGEEWIQIWISPKNVFRPRLATVENWGDPNDEDAEFLNEMLVIYLSNKGRGFEETTWDYVSEFDLNGNKTPPFTWLKRKLEEGDITDQFTSDPVWSNFTEPLQPLKGSSLERLGFLLTKAETQDEID